MSLYCMLYVLRVLIVNYDTDVRRVENYPIMINTDANTSSAKEASLLFLKNVSGTLEKNKAIISATLYQVGRRNTFDVLNYTSEDLRKEYNIFKNIYYKLI